MQNKFIVVLANSVKSSGRCLAGKEVFDDGKTWKIGGWIRPVATKEGGEIFEYQMSQALGHDPKLLEIVEIPFSEAVPLPFQPENWLIERPLKAGSWKSHGMIEWNEATSLLDQNPEIWHDPTDDDRRVREGFPEKMKLPASLYFIKPDKINSIRVWTHRNTHPEATKPTKGRRVFSVTHKGHVHDFEIEDPKFAEKYYPQFPGVDDPAKVIRLASPEETLLCVSLAGRFHGHHYKIAAGIFEPDAKRDKGQ
jgi:hypothetical protein